MKLFVLVATSAFAVMMDISVKIHLRKKVSAA
jgi:hypothetical protein